MCNLRQGLENLIDCHLTELSGFYNSKLEDCINNTCIEKKFLLKASIKTSYVILK